LTEFQVLVFDGFDELDALGVYEPLRMAGQKIEYVSLYEQGTISAINGTRIVVDKVLSLERKPNVLVVPGGGWVARAATGARAECEKGYVLEKLREFHSAGVILASVCTGTMLLAKAGLLKGRRCTTNHAAVDELRECGVDYVQERVVDDGEIITARGITSSLDLGLWLIERFVNRETSERIEKMLEYKRV
jgi:transcriptional regulator GlxA family with amidase domain